MISKFSEILTAIENLHKLKGKDNDGWERDFIVWIGQKLNSDRSTYKKKNKKKPKCRAIICNEPSVIHKNIVTIFKIYRKKKKLFNKILLRA